MKRQVTQMIKEDNKIHSIINLLVIINIISIFMIENIKIPYRTDYDREKMEKHGIIYSVILTSDIKQALVITFWKQT